MSTPTNDEYKPYSGASVAIFYFRHSLRNDNHADRQPSDHITSEPSEIVAGNPAENGEQAYEVFLDALNWVAGQVSDPFSDGSHWHGLFWMIDDSLSEALH